MLFNSLQFVIFFPVVSIIYFLIPHKYRWSFLLVASYVFYMGWNAAYATLLFGSTFVTYIASILIDKAGKTSYKKLWLTLSIVINLGVLFTFKYFDFFFDSLYALFDALNLSYTPIKFSLVLPVGISFYVFQALGYSIDVYRKDIPVQKHFGKYALFVSFFPQLVAGPIERSKNLLPQFDEVHKFNYADATSGLRLMAWGFFKKIVIADTLCTTVNKVYNNMEVYDGTAILIATVLFAFQVFCDFSGYSDIARGCARIMGFRLMKNFDYPYFATSTKDLWRRWHISLSTWFKDYIYVPLGGSRKGKVRTYINLLITFVCSGLWHGANWTYVIWGGYNGVLQVIGDVAEPARKKCRRALGLHKIPRIHRAFQVVFVFALFCAGLVFFRANTVSDAWYAISKIFTLDIPTRPELFSLLKSMFVTRAEVYRLLLTLPVFIVACCIDYKWSISRIVTSIPFVIRYVIYVLIVVYVMLFARAEMQDFIYFQF